MHFAYPHLLWLLAAIPALALFLALTAAARRRAALRFADSAMLARLAGASPGRRRLKDALTTAAAALLVLALARPQFGTRMINAGRSGSDIVVAVDVSASMLARDIAPSRLEKAKDVLGTLVGRLGGDRVGIVAFAGTAFRQCPLTFDIAAAELFLRIMDANLIPLPGTAIGSAIRLGMRELEKTAPKAKAIVLLTDGEDHESDPEGAAAEAARQGIRIYTIGFGKPEGEPIPVFDARGDVTGYKKDRNGKVVMSRLDEALLRRIAEMTGGAYFRAEDGNVETARLLDRLSGLEKTRTASTRVRRFEDRYQWFLLPGLLFLFAGLFIPETAGKGRKGGGR